MEAPWAPVFLRLPFQRFHLLVHQYYPVDSNYICNIVAKVRAGYPAFPFLKVISFTAKPYVSALSILTNEEKESGVVCIDIGSGSTSISIFIDGSIVFAKSINIGAWYISSDISKVLSTPFDQAEAIKTFYGSALRGPNDGEEIFSTPLMGSDSDERLSLSKSRLISIIQPRFYEILMHAKKYIEQSGYNDIAKRNTVITGGGSELIGSVEFSERTLESRAVSYTHLTLPTILLV